MFVTLIWLVKYSIYRSTSRSLGTKINTKNLGGNLYTDYWHIHMTSFVVGGVTTMTFQSFITYVVISGTASCSCEMSAQSKAWRSYQVSFKLTVIAYSEVQATEEGSTSTTWVKSSFVTAQAGRCARKAPTLEMHQSAWQKLTLARIGSEFWTGWARSDEQVCTYPYKLAEKMLCNLYSGVTSTPINTATSLRSPLPFSSLIITSIQ